MQVSGQSLLPAAAMYEAAAATISLAATGQPADTSLALAGLAIASPMPIAQHSDSILEVCLAPVTGGMTIYSLNVGAGRRQLHVRTNTSMAMEKVGGVMIPGEISSSEANSRPGAVAAPVNQACAMALMPEAIAKLQRYNGGTVAAIDASQELPSSGYFIHPAVADACFHSGAVFAPVATASEAGAYTKAAAKLPISAAALAVPARLEGSVVFSSMGGARLLPDGTTFSDSRLVPAQSAAGLLLSLSEMQAKPVHSSASAHTTVESATNDMLYAVEWRAATVGTAEGSLTMRQKAVPPEVEWAAVPPHGRLKRFKLPASARQNLVAPSSAASAMRAAAVAAGSLAVVQSMLDMAFTPGQRLQLNASGTVAEGLAPVHGLGNGTMHVASAGAILKVCSDCCAALVSVSRPVGHGSELVIPYPGLMGGPAPH